MRNPSTSPGQRIIRLASMSILAVLLLALFFSAMDVAAPVSAERPAQEGYPTQQFPTFDTGYPGGGDDFPTVDPGDYPPGGVFTPDPPLGDTPEAPGPGQPAVTEIPPTPTPPTPNIFETENAEMGDGNATPPPSETPGPTITPFVTGTPTQGTGVPTRTPALGKTSEERVDWGLFWIGFSIPVVSACGLVLYLLDQRPDLFRPRKK